MACGLHIHLLLLGTLAHIAIWAARCTVNEGEWRLAVFDSQVGRGRNGLEVLNSCSAGINLLH